MPYLEPVKWLPRTVEECSKNKKVYSLTLNEISKESIFAKSGMTYGVSILLWQDEKLRRCIGFSDGVHLYFEACSPYEQKEGQ